MDNATIRPNQIPKKQVCPHLGLKEDPASHFSFPEEAHLCFAAKQSISISEEHQTKFCFGKDFRSCPRFVEPVAAETVVADSALHTAAKSEGTSKLWRTLLWGLAGLVTGLLIIGGIIYYRDLAIQSDNLTPQPVVQQSLTTPTLVATPTTDTSTPAGGAFLATPTPTITPLPGTDSYVLSPQAADVGWVTSAEARGNHFGDSYLYAGIFEGQIYQSGFQIDLSTVPRGAPIHSASIELIGLSGDRLAKNLDQTRVAAGWLLRMLDKDLDQNWRRSNYQTIFNARALQTLRPILTEEDLAVGKQNVFELTAEQIEILETRIVEDEEPTVAFRLEGPVIGPDNLFAWDTGFGSNSNGNKVVLRLNVGSAPATPPPYRYVVVTSTPTPENVVTAAALALQMTAEATRVGTATPVPPNMVTPTPFPSYLVIVPTSTPENIVTAQAMAVEATAAAITTGTPLPFPTNAVTATPIPTKTPTPVPTAPIYVIITSTPTPEDIFAAATVSVMTTARAQRFGTATPLPFYWVTPAVVTSTPTPLNQGTVQALAQLSTAIAMTTGTPTPIPSNMVTATPTPIFETIPLIVTPSATPPPTATPQTIPPALVGKVLFKSDREGPDSGFIYAYDLETGELARLTDSWPYEVALARDSWSADGRFRAFTKDTLQYGNRMAPAIHIYDYLYDAEEQVTKFGAGIAYGGAWSPVASKIAFVSNDSGDDEIWVADYNGDNIRQLTDNNAEFNAREIGKDTFVAELSKFPSWSPDGTEIVFMSTRTGNQQLWVMEADGSDQRLLMGWDNWTPYNDTEPVWVKYLDPAPPAVQ